MSRGLPQPAAKRERGLTVNAEEEGLLAGKLSEEGGQLFLRAT